MTKKEECLKALQCLYLEVDATIADDVKRKVLDALDEANKNFVQPDVMRSLPPADEMWDDYSEHIDSDIDSLQMVAGTTVMIKSQFMKMFDKMKEGGNDA